MDETARRRARHPRAHRNDTDRKNAAAALQRALDRRDNGGAPGR
ncbi:hypothetical protein V1L54_04245 [Streptomyces sp. TRM 70361]|nr:hypothetical protein [Streptomyces sp. TRM 70361]MEE1938627.1 hypothetical protein [Streptomyces sp. TRM 70361]